MDEAEKITIVEGPPPTFELVNDPWLMGLTESLVPNRIAVCQVRTFNGPALVDRCYRAWNTGVAIRLEYRSDDGMTHEAPIVAIRWMEIDEGHLLFVWVRLQESEIEVEIDFDFEDYGDDFGDDLDESDFDLGL